MNLQNDLDKTLNIEISESPKGINPFGDFSCCILKKCCKNTREESVVKNVQINNILYLFII